MQKWKCTVCVYIHEGDTPPDKCPRCGAPKDKFEKIPDDQSKLIDRSRLTNALHKKLFTLLEEIEQIGSKGVEDNLDPGCVTIFTRAKDEAKLLRKFILAEIEVHVNIGKWG